MKRLVPAVLMLALLSVPVAAASSTDDHAPEIQAGLALRQTYGVQIPHGTAAVYLASEAVHHTRTVYSAIAWRDETGVWRVSSMGEQGPGGLLRVEKSLIPETTRILPGDVGQRLDRLLGDPALYSERPQASPPTGVGGPAHTLEIESGPDHSRAQWMGRLHGRTGEVADIVLDSLQ